MTDDQVRFIDAEQYQGRGDEKLTFRMIVLQHLERIARIASQDLHGGYWRTRERQVGISHTVDREYVPDSRQEYINAVDYLHDILSPHFDEQMRKEMKEYDAFESKTLEELRKKYIVVVNGEQKGFNKDAYENQVVKVVKRRLFRFINSFLYRTKYMEGKSFVDEV